MSKTIVPTRKYHRWTFEEVKEKIEIERYRLLSKEYKSYHSHLIALCPQGHQYEFSWHNFRRGIRCPCQKAQRIPWTVERVREVLSKRGYHLLSKKYTNNRTKMEAICPNRHRCKFSLQIFLKGHGCFCERKNHQWTFEEIRQLLKREQYTLLSEEYIDSHALLRALCPNKHERQFSWTNFQQGYRCPCKNGKTLWTIKTIRDFVHQQGYNLLSTEYKKTTDRLQVKCSAGHEYSVTWNNFQQGHRCSVCQHIVLGMKRKKPFGQIVQRVEQENYQFEQSLIYNGCKDKFTLKCPEGHQFDTCWNYWQRGHRCPYCLHKSEHKLGQILEELFPNKIKKQGNLGFLGRQRVDYYIPNLKIAIEYDGEQHYHPLPGVFGVGTFKEAQIRLKETRQRDKRKEQLCKENGWRLIRIRYDEPLTLEHIRKRIEGQQRVNE